MSLVESNLSRISFCNAGRPELTVEFGLEADVVSAVAGDCETAPWQLLADQPYPELGVGRARKACSKPTARIADGGDSGKGNLPLFCRLTAAIRGGRSVRLKV